MNLLPATSLTAVLDRVEIRSGEGIFTFHSKDKVPQKGFMIHEALEAADLLKKQLKLFLWIAGMKPVRYFLVPLFFLRSKTFLKILTRFFEGFADSAHHVMKYVSTLTQQSATLRGGRIEGKDYFVARLPQIVFKEGSMLILKPEYLSTSVREIHRVLALMFPTREGEILTDALCLILENDRPYRYRAQDILSEIDKDAIQRNTPKELKRGFALLVSRDKAREWKDIGNLIYLATFLRKDIQGYVQEFFYHLNQYEIAFDENDVVAFAASPSYDFMGMSVEEREGMVRQMTVDEKGRITMYDREL